MNGSDIETRKPIIPCLAEGRSVRTTARTADVGKNTVSKLSTDAGKACADYRDKVPHDLPCLRIRVGEFRSFNYAKEANVARARSAPPPFDGGQHPGGGDTVPGIATNR